MTLTLQNGFEAAEAQSYVDQDRSNFSRYPSILAAPSQYVAEGMMPNNHFDLKHLRLPT
jgi:hypothetical protein